MTAVLMIVFINNALSQDGSKNQIHDEFQFKTAVYLALVPVVVSFTFAVFLVYRHRRENYFKQKELQLRLDKSQLEMKVLRAQVDPHFIFNCLNSIQHYLHHNSESMAEEYLVKFSRLIRLILENSAYEMIPIEDDLMTLDLYIQMEQLRLEHSFSYHIEVADDIDVVNASIPPMLIQPFVENSIWHGLTNVDAGMVSIKLVTSEGHIKCSIKDNGKKRVKKSSHPFNKGKKSLGLQLIKERLQSYNEMHDSNARFEMRDIIDDQDNYNGKLIELYIPYLSD